VNQHSAAPPPHRIPLTAAHIGRIVIALLRVLSFERSAKNYLPYIRANNDPWSMNVEHRVAATKRSRKLPVNATLVKRVEASCSAVLPQARKS
jgi:hypothetical protein